MKTRIILVCVAIFAILGWGSVEAQHVDLKGGTVVARSLCTEHNKQYVCVIVEKDGKTYGVLVDQKGEHSIYLVDGGEMKLIWSRGSV